MNVSLQGVPDKATPGVDMPPGRTDIILSAASGLPLRYFTPDPLPTLFQRSEGLKQSHTPARDEVALTLSLIRTASCSTGINVPDVIQARRIGLAALGRAEFKTPELIIQLGASISSRAACLRREIVFSGSSNASNSNLVFAPHEALPRLLSELAEGLQNLPRNLSPTIVSAIVGFFCVHMHPFLDGNGRWARVLIAQAVTTSDHTASPVISASFQAALKVELATRVWPSTRAFGFRSYFELANAFETQLRDRLAGSEELALVTELLSVLRQYTPTQREFERLAVETFATNLLDWRSVKRTLGLSTKKLDGLSKRTSQLLGDQDNEEAASVKFLTDTVSQMVATAKTKAMETV